jgi:5-methylcytosine-specific restriction endonuclease McrA
MGKRLAGTPRSRVRQALRQLSLRSRERAAALRRDKYICQCCGAKKSVAKGKEVKVEAHHVRGIGNWEKVINLIYEEILVAPDLWETLCHECHKKQEVK